MIFADHLSRNVNPEASEVPTVPSLNLEISSLELNAIGTELNWSILDKSLNVTLRCLC